MIIISDMYYSLKERNPASTIEQARYKNTAFLIVLLIFFITSHNLHSLEFQNKKISHSAKIHDLSFTATYKFTNTSKNEVTIEKLKPSCNCLVTKLDKLSYASGDKGSISLTFKYQNKIGLQQNRLKVYLKGKKEPIILVLEVFIPQRFTFSKRFVVWKGENRKKNIIQLKLHKDFDAEVSLHSSTKEKIPFQFKLVKNNPKGFDIEITPEVKLKKGKYTLIIKFTTSTPPQQISYLYLLVQ